MAYKGKYTLKCPKKYVGDPSKVVYRSLWERQTFRWLEDQDNIIEWCSEEVVVPYVCQTDRKVHRYFIDVYYKTKDGKKFLIEIKPKKETSPPKKTTRSSKRYITESLTYIKNMSKWKAATQFAKDNGCTFQIWTEDTLKSLGIKIIK
jgi:hypothetical protein|tara:strand:+ start:2897 stop:3340 length:444 start_codon:yes stop_codon:yes gene_type:complete